MRLPLLSSSPLQVWAVEDTSVQLTWGLLPPGQVTAWVRDAHVSVDHDGGPGGLDLVDLAPDSDHRIDVTWEGGRAQLVATTLPSPPGELLCRIATISDLHLGAKRWGASKTMLDRSGHEQPFPTRCAVAALHEASAWGADLLVVKGDAAHHQDPADFAAVGELLDSVPELPVLLIPGNHEVDGHTEHPTPAKVGERGIPFVRDAACFDLPGIRVIVADTTVPGSGIGTVHRCRDDVLELAGLTDGPFLLGIHHQLEPHRFPTHYPIGVRSPASVAFLDDLGLVNPDGLVSSGHTHRNRARRHGPLAVSEVASTRDWPGVWGGYAVHEGGIRQVVRRATAPHAISWHEYSRRALFGIWEHWAAGTLAQRCLVHPWDGR